MTKTTFIGLNSHEVGGADGVLDVKELTIWEAVAIMRWASVIFTWEAVALRALFHLPQELVSFVDAKEICFRNVVDKTTQV